MPKPVNVLGVLKDAQLQSGASVRRSKRCAKHIDKLGDADLLSLINTIVGLQERLEKQLEKALTAEQRRVRVVRGEQYG